MQLRLKLKYERFVQHKPALFTALGCCHKSLFAAHQSLLSGSFMILKKSISQLFSGDGGVPPVYQKSRIWRCCCFLPNIIMGPNPLCLFDTPFYILLGFDLILANIVTNLYSKSCEFTNAIQGSPYTCWTFFVLQIQGVHTLTPISSFIYKSNSISPMASIVL